MPSPAAVGPGVKPELPQVFPKASLSVGMGLLRLHGLGVTSHKDFIVVFSCLNHCVILQVCIWAVQPPEVQLS